MRRLERKDLEECVYRHYPARMLITDERYAQMPERQRAESAWREALRDESDWHRLLDLIQQRVGQDGKVSDLTLPYHFGARRVPVFLAGTELVAIGCVSVFAPVYITYGLAEDRSGRAEPKVVADPPPRLRDCLNVVESAIVDVFDYAPLPPGLGRVIVPDIHLERRRMGEATLCDALISSDLTHVFH